MHALQGTAVSTSPSSLAEIAIWHDSRLVGRASSVKPISSPSSMLGGPTTAIQAGSIWDVTCCTGAITAALALDAGNICAFGGGHDGIDRAVGNNRLDRPIGQLEVQRRCLISHVVSGQ